MSKWTKKENRALLDGVGSYGWKTLQKKTGRSRGAILQKVRRDYGGGGITRGTYSLRQAQEETGYSHTHLRRAAKALGQRWARTGKGSSHTFLITGEQLEDAVVWLLSDYWSKALKLYACVNCGTKTQPHFSFGCCKTCFFRLRRKAVSYGFTFTADAFIKFIDTLNISPSHTLGQIRYNLSLRRAPTLSQLEYLHGYQESDCSSGDAGG